LIVLIGHNIATRSVGEVDFDRQTLGEGTGVNYLSDRLSGPTVTPDHATDIARSDVNHEADRVVTFATVDLYRFGVVDDAHNDGPQNVLGNGARDAVAVEIAV
jgi:hypothetical protein